jgi:hydroxylamine reductase
VGVCGKTPTVAGLQDLLMYSLKGLGGWAHAARAAGITSFEVDSFINNAIFSTLTNGGCWERGAVSDAAAVFGLPH